MFAFGPPYQCIVEHFYACRGKVFWYITELSLPGLLQGILTGIRGLSNGFGPAVFGLLFYFFHVELDESSVMDETDPALEEDITKSTAVSVIQGRSAFMISIWWDNVLYKVLYIGFTSLCRGKSR